MIFLLSGAKFIPQTQCYELYQRIPKMSSLKAEHYSGILLNSKLNILRVVYDHFLTTAAQPRLHLRTAQKVQISKQNRSRMKLCSVEKILFIRPVDFMIAADHALLHLKTTVWTFQVSSPLYTMPKLY